jgi:hypothetical protein
MTNADIVEVPVESVALDKKKSFRNSRFARLFSPASGANLYTRLTSVSVVVGATIFLFLTLHPNLIFSNNTPTGGDMGAHVWGPAYLRDHLIPNWRLTGWSMDWYSGFPVYRFYMIIPALLIVLLNTIMPYGVALKLVAVLGILALPWASWKFGKLTRFAFPIPELLALAATVFLYDESFTIYGGNIASTLAGEFSFSIALTLAVLGFGLFAHCMYTGERRILTAVVIALAALSHGVVLIFVFMGVGSMMLVWHKRQNIKAGLTVIGLAALLSSFWVMPFITGQTYMSSMKYEPRPSGAGDSYWQMFFPLPMFWNITLMILAVVGVIGCVTRKHLVGIWLGIFSIILAAFVFLASTDLPGLGMLWNPRILPFFYLLRYMLVMMGIFEIVVFIFRYVSLEKMIKANNKETSPHVLFNAPKSIRYSQKFNIALLASVAVIVTFITAFHFQVLPFGKVTADASNTSIYKWGPISTKVSNDGFVDGWAKWNFSGYENKGSYGEYRDVVQTMKSIGQDSEHGCGRALWENNSDLNKYGTTMALMLLPYWTNSCISSEEGLFFEASGTTPYHFITTAAMSKQSSNPVRELRYDNLDASLGINYMQQLGIKYFMAYTPEAIEQASSQNDLSEIARSGPWVIFEVANSDIVVPLHIQPVVVDSRNNNAQERWLEIGTSWFQHPENWPAIPAASGPAKWKHVAVKIDYSLRQGEPGDLNRLVDVVIPSKPISEVTVLKEVTISNIQLDDSSLKFSVDEIGVPVLVKISYFPNWQVSGAKGPYRVAPNMMVVVPTSKSVHLYFKQSQTDMFAYLLTLLGIILVFTLRWREKRSKRQKGASVVVEQQV